MAERFVNSTDYREWPASLSCLQALFAVALKAGVIFLADTGTAIVGMLALVVVPHMLTGESYAEELCWWVEPEARGGTAAWRLLAAAEDYARQQHLSCLKMVQPAGEPTVGKIYTRRGFRPVEVVFVLRL